MTALHLLKAWMAADAALTTYTAGLAVIEDGGPDHRTFLRLHRAERNAQAAYYNATRAQR
ncbi:hypothetical protein RM780_07880 [Streptomyces sp. DSM 44917]|uniref:Uncharacterized protein n=1 Tax=Streptomyces boetiae TaxID=3075541 RepID=A0ABU2L605_9ACTN|nr:hypothetical protein [Streptomyces sp. DSM 44917]MDT0306881.1 hypothetical protein [Streptomyces sp. DSM 44917]